MSGKSRKILFTVVIAILAVWAATRLFARLLESSRASSPEAVAEETRDGRENLPSFPSDLK